MNITITLLSRNEKGRQRKVIMDGKISNINGHSHYNLKRLWEAERTINELTSIRMHLSVDLYGEQKDGN